MRARRIECFGQVKNLRGNLPDRVSSRLAIPQELLSDAPLVQLHGRQCVSVENHGGILEYTQELVRIAVRRGRVCVVGSGMEIWRMTKRMVEIRGRIQRVEME